MISRPQLLFAVPTAIGALVAAVISGVLLLPQWQQVQAAGSRGAELRQLEAQLPLMTRQLSREQEGVEEGREQQAVVLQLIAGSGSLATFMAKLDGLASLTGVKLSLFEPQTAASPAPDPKAAAQPKPGSQQQAPPSPPDPLLRAPGVAKQEVLLSASGRYPDVLAFMRQLEKLNVFVRPSNLQISVAEVKGSQSTPAKGGDQASSPVQLKLNLATYYRTP